MFVNRDLDAPPLAEFLGGLPAIIEAAGIDFSQLRFRERQNWELKANWKAVVENYLECYHCPTAHPGFSKVIDVDPDAYQLTSDRWFSSQVGRVRQEALDGDWIGTVPAGRRRHPGGPLPLPLARVHHQCSAGKRQHGGVCLPPDRRRPTMTFSDCFYGEDVSEEEIEEIDTFLEQVGLEDQELVESIQRAARVGRARRRAAPAFQRAPDPALPAPGRVGTGLS